MKHRNIALLFVLVAEVAADDLRACPVVVREESVEHQLPVPELPEGPILDGLWSQDRRTRLAAVERVETESGEEDMNLAQARALFARRDDEWLLDRLALALIDDSHDFVAPLFRELLQHPSRNVRQRAIQFFAEEEDPAVMPVLLDLLVHEELPSWARAELIAALDWQVASADPYTLAGLEPSLALVQDPAAEVRAAVAEALSNYPASGRAIQALLALMDDVDHGVQMAALDSLATLEVPAADERMLAVLGDAARPLAFRLRVLGVLGRAQDPLVRQRASARMAGMAEYENPGLRPFLEQAFRETQAPQTIAAWFPLARQERFLVKAAEGQFTVRCWDGPGLAGDPEKRFRLLHGFPVLVEDRFVRGDELWIEDAGFGCWLPEGSLTSDGVSADPLTAAGARTEADVRVTDLDTRLAESLENAGFLEVFEIEGDVAAVAIEVERDDEQELVRFLDLLERGNSPLHSAVKRELAEALGRLDRESDAFQRALALLTGD